MTDKKITDEEIIKAALEAEIHLAEYVDSDYCSNTEVSLLKSSLDLINSQKAEIERLGKRISGQKHAPFKQHAYTAELQNEIVKLKDYNENLLAANTVLSNEVLESKAKAEAEVYKEFADKVKQELMPYDLGAFSAVRAVLKDLTGEDTNDLQIL